MEHTVAEDVPGPPDDVRAFYIDLENIKLVHPLVVSVRTVDRSETADGYVQTYRVSDRIPVGPFTCGRVTLRGCMSRLPVTCCPRPDSSLAYGCAAPWRSSRSRSGTRVVERIRIEAPRPLAPMTTRKAVEAHTEMLAGIRRRFEPAPS